MQNPTIPRNDSWCLAVSKSTDQTSWPLHSRKKKNLGTKIVDELVLRHNSSLTQSVLQPTGTCNSQILPPSQSPLPTSFLGLDCVVSDGSNHCLENTPDSICSVPCSPSVQYITFREGNSFLLLLFPHRQIWGYKDGRS